MGFRFRKFRSLPFAGIIVTSLLLIISVIVVKQEQQFLTKADTVIPVKIMIVGDSKAHGHSGDYTWRYRLWQHLTSHNVSVDFVGPRDTVYDDAGPNYAYVDPNFDRDHDALWGRQILQEKQTIAATVSAYRPDVMLVDLGANDLVWWGMSGQQAADQMAELLTNAFSAKADMKVILAKITPRYNSTADYTARWSDYNARLASVAASFNTPSQRVWLADLATGYNPNPTVDAWDGVHPAPQGEYKIAAAFADVLANNLGIGVPFGPIPQAPAWPPAPPTVSAAPINAGTILTWSAIPGATGYYIYMRDVTAGQATLNPLQCGTSRCLIQSTSFTGGLMYNGHTYEFAVKSFRGIAENSVWLGHEGSLSTPVQVIPGVPTPTPSPTLTPTPTLTLTPTMTPSPTPIPAPTGLTAKAGVGSVALSWKAVSGAISYNVYRKDVTAGQTTFIKLSTTAVTYSMTGLTNGHVYQFTVSSVNASGQQGPVSSVVSATPLAKPAAPTGLFLTPGIKKVDLKWNKVTGATSYKVYFRKASVTTFSSVIAPSNTTFVPNLVTGTTYYFKVTAINVNNTESLASAVLSTKVK